MDDILSMSLVCKRMYRLTRDLLFEMSLLEKSNPPKEAAKGKEKEKAKKRMLLSGFFFLFFSFLFFSFLFFSFLFFSLNNQKCASLTLFSSFPSKKIKIKVGEARFARDGP